MVEATYVELHLHTNYSLLEGASHPLELVQTAAKYGYHALAITDHDNLYGAMNFATVCHEYGIRPITGLELTLAEDLSSPRQHLTLLAENRTGYANLCRLASIAHGHTLPDHKQQAKRRRDPLVLYADLAAHTSGVICLTGCRQSEIAMAIAKRNWQGAKTALQRLITWFGPEAVYAELMDNLVQGDRSRNDYLQDLAQHFGIKSVVTGDVHYHERQRHRLQDALVAIRHHTSIDQCQQYRRPNSCFQLRRPEQQIQRFARYPEALAATLEVAQRCQFDIADDLGYQLPSPPVPSGLTPDSHLQYLCQQQLAHKYSSSDIPAARTRLEEELVLISRHRLAGFFLIYHQVLQLAEEVAQEIRLGKPRANVCLSPGRGRGSSVGSIVCYLIGLSHIDPIRNNLYLGRFLNEEMRGLPDIDLDFPRDIRSRLFERVYEYWGRDHAAIVGLFPTYRIRSAIRDLGKALTLPPSETDRLAKLAEGYGSAKTVEVEMSRSPQFASLVKEPGWRQLIELSTELAGFPRHLSQHVGGVVIASEPLVDCVPIEPAAWPGRYVCHWDKDAIADARMVKIDFLGLGMLSLVEDCIDLIAEHRAELVDLSRINFQETAVYDRICQGDTIGVFQVESRAQASMLTRSQPRNLDDLACQVAIVRPGPVAAGSMRSYIEFREKQRQDPAVQIQIPHPLLEPVLRETLGAVLFQEQVLQVSSIIAGFSPGQAEELRRALGRRDWPQRQDHYHSLFLQGAQSRGISSEIAEKLFAQVAGFAQFGFPKSHATAFALLAYQSAWLREHYAPEFYCALYNQWPMGFYPPHVVTNDARRRGVKILRPDVNQSQPGCTVEGSAVRLGFNYVKGVGQSLGTIIAQARLKDGIYTSLFDCLQRTGMPHPAMEGLIQVGACDSFGLNRRELIWQLNLLKASGKRPQTSVQLRLSLPIEQDAVELADFSDWDRMARDYTLLGLSPNAHPLGLMRPQLPATMLSASQMLDCSINQLVTTAGLVVCRQRPGTARDMVFLALEDETGIINVTINAELYKQERVAIRTSPLLKIKARLEGKSGAVPMLWALDVSSLQPLQPGIYASHNWM